jgi:RHS repeat-associated protein
MPNRSFSASSYKYGFNGQEKDDEIKGGGNSLDFGARIHDSRLGKWLSMDPLTNNYPEYTPYSFCGNSPILFIDIGGKVIGNPNSPDAQKFKAALEKTPTGKILWERMVKSPRTIHVHIAEKNDEEGQVSGNINSHLRKQGFQTKGQTVTGKMFSLIAQGKSKEASTPENSGLTYNSTSGVSDKTSDWNETHLLINGDFINKESKTAKTDPEAYATYLLIIIGSEEAEHALQDVADIHITVKKGDKFIDTGEQKKYYDQQHEIDAQGAAQKMADEYLKTQEKASETPAPKTSTPEPDKKKDD